MPESRVEKEAKKKVTASHSPQGARHIPPPESDGLAKRIAEVQGDRTVSSFARECGFGESLLRKYLAGAQPNTSNLVAIAEAGGVTLDWLATGRPPRTRAELVALLKKGAPAPEGAPEGSELWRLAVEVVQEWQVKEGQMLAPDKFLRALELLVELSDGEPAQVRTLSAKVLRLAV